MMAESYVESIIIRLDGIDTVEPSFTDGQVDSEFEFEGTVKLIQILKSVQNASHNRHDYVFTITEIKKAKEIE
jgi:hypothetical protein